MFLTHAQIDEDIVLDPENYTRKGGSRLLGNMEPLQGVKLCHCLLCIDKTTKSWVEAMETGTDLETTDDNDLLLPPRVCGFALNRKEWCQFSLDGIYPADFLEIDPDSPNLEGLVLPDDVDDEEQRDILSMVQNHWRVMAKPPSERIADMIGGKGESLLFLFHGTYFYQWLRSSQAVY
jgi:hypothetical protein